MRCIGFAAALFGLPFVGMAPAGAQILGQGGDEPVPVWRVLAALLLCVVLAIGGAIVLRMRGGAIGFAAPRSRRLKIVEAVRLPPQSMLCIVDCDGRELLVMASPSGASLIERLQPPQADTDHRPDRIS